MVIYVNNSSTVHLDSNSFWTSTASIISSLNIFPYSGKHVRSIITTTDYVNNYHHVFLTSIYPPLSLHLVTKLTPLHWRLGPDDYGALCWSFLLFDFPTRFHIGFFFPVSVPMGVSNRLTCFSTALALNLQLLSSTWWFPLQFGHFCICFPLR
jgi:hypothetical protein